ncbi:hypothetical protein H8356DRAFT_948024 [Neocallimastix lanati (nom. inval.)]|jgi:hypothetical protein|nr:hypothetical protein H8356DRAFT_948024 [Neocallimastix sp. JGI-2020a]
MSDEINKDSCTFINSEYKFRNYVLDNYEGNVGIFINLNTISGKIYIFLEIIAILYYFIPLIWIIKYRNWYIFKQRNFTLTFIGSIANFICTFSNSSTNIIKMPCSFAYYSATIATSVMQICYVFRAFRLILLYKLNIFKVTMLDDEKFIKKSDGHSGLIEPNIYYRSIYRLVNRRLTKILIPLFVFFVSLISIGFHIKANYDNKGYGTICGMTFVDINARINSEMYGKCFMEKEEKNATLVSGINKENVSTFSLMRTMFRIPEALTILFIALCLVITFIFAFTEINDNQKFGYKFDCLSSAIISIIVGLLYFYFKIQMADIVTLHTEWDNLDSELTGKHQIYLRSKQGILFFVIIGIYIQLTSVIIPLIQCIYIEHCNKMYENDSLNTIEFFYKVLNTPSLLEELKVVAVQEFSVENVLFWENYCLLHKLVSRVIRRMREAKNEDKMEMDYIRSSLILQDIISNNSSSYSGSGSANVYDDITYSPEIPIQYQLIPYFDAFYYTFIDIDGPATVNITSNITERINNEFNTNPTIGIFDEAKEEVVETMFFSIYPIFLQRNRNQLGKINNSNK